MGLTTRNLQNQKELKEETKNYKFLEFGVDRGHIEWDTANQKPQNSLRNAYMSGQRAQQSIHLFLNIGPINPLSPNSDQDQFSPNNIHTLSTDKLWELLKRSPN